MRPFKIFQNSKSFVVSEKEVLQLKSPQIRSIISLSSQQISLSFLMIPVKATTHIQFDEEFKTFRLHSGKSLYAFCIGPELSLEHLYWGVALEAGYDLRYLSQSCRSAHFSTVEASAHNFNDKIFLEAETLEEVQKTWKANKSFSRLKSNSLDDITILQRRRLENYSWRIISKATQDGQKNNNISQNNSSDVNDSSNLLSTPRVSFRSAAMPKASPLRKFDESSALPENRSRSLSASNTENNNATFPELPDLPTSSPCKHLQLDTQNLMNTTLTPSKLYNPKRNKRVTFDRDLGKMGKGAWCSEYTDYGTGDFRSPSFMVVDNFNGSNISPLRYKKHAIYRGKLPMPDSMPAIRCATEREASTLVVTMSDINTGLEVDLVYGELIFKFWQFLRLNTFELKFSL